VIEIREKCDPDIPCSSCTCEECNGLGTDLVSVAARQVGGEALHLLPALGEHFGITVRRNNKVPPTLHTTRDSVTNGTVDPGPEGSTSYIRIPPL
jgi:hypothetical protein